MKRLTKRSNKTVHDNGVCCTHFMGFECSERMGECTDNCPWEEAVWSKLADYEDKQEQGLLISLPCKVGDTVYQIGKGWYQVGNDICEFVVTAITISKDKIIISVENENQMGFPVSIDCIGNRLYLTRSDAEEALARMGGK